MYSYSLKSNSIHHCCKAQRRISTTHSRNSCSQLVTFLRPDVDFED